MSDASPVITEDDLAGLNQRAILRTVDVGRRASIVLLLVAGVIALAWVWQTFRYQGVITDGDDQVGFSIGVVGEDLTWKQRLDAISLTMTMPAFAAIVAGLGLVLRVLCDLTTVRVGGSLTGLAVGDPLDPVDPDEPLELDRP